MIPASHCAYCLLLLSNKTGFTLTNYALKWFICMINWPYKYVESNLALRQHFWRYLKCGKIVRVLPDNLINQL